MTNPWVKKIYYFVIFLISVYTASFLIFVVVQEVFRILERPGIGRQPFYFILLATFVISSAVVGMVVMRSRPRPGADKPVNEDDKPVNQDE